MLGALLSLKLALPYLQVPYMLTSVAVVLSLCWVLISNIDFLDPQSTTPWRVVTTLVLNVILLLQLVFIYAKVSGNSL